MVIWVSETQIKDFFPHLSTPSDMSEHVSVFPNNALLEWNRLSLCKSPENSHQGHRSKRCFWWKSVREDVKTVTTQWAFDALMHLLWSTPPRWGQSKSCLRLFSPCFCSWFNSYAALAPCDAGIWSILGLGGSGAASKKTRQWMCSIGCVMLW